MVDPRLFRSTMRAIIYARVSTEEQKRKGYSIEGQIEACKSYAGAKGWEIIKIYKEPKSAKEGSIEKRKELQRALTFLEVGGADILLVWRLDRVTRSIIDFTKIIERIGNKLASVTEGLDMSTPSGRLMANILASFAQYERESNAERTRLGLERVRKEGKKIGRPPIISDEEKEKIIKLRKRGYTIKEISEKTGIKYNTVKTICYRAGV